MGNKISCCFLSPILKDYKLAIAEVRTLSKMAVFSRLKQDYATISSRGGKVTSSYDSRISFTVPRNGIDGKDHVIMEVRFTVKQCDNMREINIFTEGNVNAQNQ